MDTYHVRAEDIRGSESKATKRAALLGVILFCGLFALDSFWPGPRSSGALMWSAVGDGIFAILVAASLRWYTEKRKKTAINIDGDLIISKVNGSFRKLHRDQIKTIVEDNETFFHDGGMLLSKYGWLGTRYLGGIWIPRELPEYEAVKRFVEGRSLAR